MVGNSIADDGAMPYVKANKRLSSLQQTQLQSDALSAIQGDRGVCVNGQEQKSAAKSGYRIRNASPR